MDTPDSPLLLNHLVQPVDPRGEPRRPTMEQEMALGADFDEFAGPVGTLLRRAIEARADDLRIDVRETADVYDIAVSMRVDGDVTPVVDFPLSLGDVLLFLRSISLQGIGDESLCDDFRQVLARIPCGFRILPCRVQVHPLAGSLAPSFTCVARILDHGSDLGPWRARQEVEALERDLADAAPDASSPRQKNGSGSVRL